MGAAMAATCVAAFLSNRCFLSKPGLSMIAPVVVVQHPDVDFRQVGHHFYRVRQATIAQRPSTKVKP
jgi:hypothetical protein